MLKKIWYSTPYFIYISKNLFNYEKTNHFKIISFIFSKVIKPSQVTYDHHIEIPEAFPQWSFTMNNADKFVIHIKHVDI